MAKMTTRKLAPRWVKEVIFTVRQLERIRSERKNCVGDYPHVFKMDGLFFTVYSDIDYVYVSLY